MTNPSSLLPESTVFRLQSLLFIKKNPGSEKNDGKTKQNKNENVYAAISLFLVSAFETL